MEKEETKETKQEEALEKESYDTEREILERIQILIAAKWDSDTIKSEIESLMMQYEKLFEELGKIYEKKDDR